MIGAKGLFGKKMQPGAMMPAYSMPQNEVMVDGANLGTPASKQGGGVDWKGVLMGALGGAADSAATFFGGQPLIAQQRQFQQLQAMRQQEAERQRAASLEDYRAKLGIDAEFATPEKDAFDRALVNAGIDPNSPQGVELYRQRAMTMAQGQQQEPRMVTLPDGRSIFGTMEEIQQILGATGGQPQPLRPRGKLTPIGGGTAGNGGGSFRP